MVQTSGVQIIKNITVEMTITLMPINKIQVPPSPRNLMNVELTNACDLTYVLTYNSMDERIDH
jgi:hypothetical protein